MTTENYNSLECPVEVLLTGHISSVANYCSFGFFTLFFCHAQ